MVQAPVADDLDFHRAHFGRAGRHGVARAPEIADTYIKPFGTIFLNLIKMIVVPLVLFSIIAGVVSLDDVKKVGAIGGKTVLFYLATTALCRHAGPYLRERDERGRGHTMPSGELSYEATEPPSLIDTIVNMFPSNFFQPMADATMLQVIVIAVVFGFGMIAAGKKAEPVIKICNAMSDVCIAIMRGIILVAPFGVFGLICPSSPTTASTCCDRCCGSSWWRTWP